MLDVTQNQTPLKYEVEVQAQGHIELQVPFAIGQKLVVLVLPDDRDDFRDLMSASMSSVGFWDNPIDDEVWNDA
jgi:hypothetical protein